MSRYRSDLVDLDVVVVRETEAAYGIDDGTQEGPRKALVWVPKSQSEIEYTSEGRYRSATITMPRWLAEEKGLV